MAVSKRRNNETCESDIIQGHRRTRASTPPPKHQRHPAKSPSHSPNLNQASCPAHHRPRSSAPPTPPHLGAGTQRTLSSLSPLGTYAPRAKLGSVGSNCASCTHEAAKRVDSAKRRALRSSVHAHTATLSNQASGGRFEPVVQRTRLPVGAPHQPCRLPQRASLCQGNERRAGAKVVRPQHGTRDLWCHRMPRQSCRRAAATPFPHPRAPCMCCRGNPR